MDRGGKYIINSHINFLWYPQNQLRFEGIKKYENELVLKKSNLICIKSLSFRRNNFHFLYFMIVVEKNKNIFSNSENDMRRNIGFPRLRDRGGLRSNLFWIKSQFNATQLNWRVIAIIGLYTPPHHHTFLKHFHITLGSEFRDVT